MYILLKSSFWKKKKIKKTNHNDTVNTELHEIWTVNIVRYYELLCGETYPDHERQHQWQSEWGLCHSEILWNKIKHFTTEEQNETEEEDGNYYHHVKYWWQMNGREITHNKDKTEGGTTLSSPVSTQSLSGWLLSPWMHMAGHLENETTLK